MAPAPAQLAGPEFQVNSYTTSDQVDATVAADGAGNFVVVWRSYGQDGSHDGVFGRRFTAGGLRAGSEFRVNSYTTSAQRAPALAVSAAGDFVVTWMSGQGGPGTNVFGQRFSSNGEGSEASSRSTPTPRRVSMYPAVAADAAGNFVVVWRAVRARTAFSAVISGQRFDSAGDKIGSEFQVNARHREQRATAGVAAADSGRFVVVWSTYHPGTLELGRLRATIRLGAVLRAGGEFQVNTYTTNVQWVPGVDADGAGNFVVVWNSLGQDGAAWGVFGQRFDAEGSRVGREFQVNTYTTNYQTTGSAVAIDDSGNFVVAWNSYPGQDGSRRAFSASASPLDGGPVEGEFQVNTYTTSRPVSARSGGEPVGRLRRDLERATSRTESGGGVFGQRLDTPAPTCLADGDTLCLHHNRFRAEVTWTNYAGASGSGKAVPFTADSGLFWFFGPGNLEMLIKIVDGCALNERYWVYAGATTDVEYTLTVTDTWTDVAREYSNTLGHRAPAITDSGAFATCGAAGARADAPAIAVAPDLLPAAISLAAAPADGAQPEGLSCAPGDHDLCLRGSRFRARIGWTDYAGRTGSGWAVPYATESGMFWFFDGDNIEFVVKVIDGCELNSRYWVYAAATTDVAYTLTVTDTLRDATQTYTNILGTASPAITDSSAFATCP